MTTAKSQRGQALVEYVMLLLFVVGAIGILYARVPQIFSWMEKPIRSDLPRAYKYGDPKACGRGSDDPAPCGGSPERHPAIRSGDNFRLFSRGD